MWRWPYSDWASLDCGLGVASTRSFESKALDFSSKTRLASQAGFLLLQ
jgi:hypothetical protein